ncbi:MAG TPA: glutamate ABC transporter substrate-binding protein [Solirubrobacteraceae bacterium]|nr:glutamate ABC transporter substrate-binding protein [Solirubrobacteraceae bacterium]
MSRPVRYLLGLALVAGALAGCGTTSDSALRITLAALDAPAPKPAPSTPLKPEPTCANLTASLRPPASMPAPGAMPRGSYMAAIQRRGYLIAGVNSAQLDFGYLNPATGQIEGFEIDLVKQLAQAIFGNPNDYRLVALTVPQRLPFVEEGRVDVVVDVVTITCQRKQQVDFSTVYYDAKQRVLVPSNSNAAGIGAFAGKPVCATAQSADIQVMQALPHPPRTVGLSQAVDCLVALQEGRVDAISTDDSILLGFQAQDPNTKIVGPSLADVPYGMAISKAHPDFVRFVNGVLAKLRVDGTWRRLYEKWLGHLAPNPTLPAAQYDG